MSNNRKTECSDKMVILTLTWLKLLEFKGKKGKKDCVEMSRTGKWNDQQCSDKHSFFCEKGTYMYVYFITTFINFSLLFW